MKPIYLGAAALIAWLVYSKKSTTTSAAASPAAYDRESAQSVSGIAAAWTPPQVLDLQASSVSPSTSTALPAPQAQTREQQLSAMGLVNDGTGNFYPPGYQAQHDAMLIIQKMNTDATTAGGLFS